MSKLAVQLEERVKRRVHETVTTVASMDGSLQQSNNKELQ
jgi:hypothetical protein